MTGFKLVEGKAAPANGPDASTGSWEPGQSWEPGPSWEPGHFGQAVGDALWAVPAPIGSGDPSVLSGATITVVDDGERVAPLVAVLLKSHGARALVVNPDEIPDVSDGIIHLGQLHATTQVPVDLFDDVYPVAMAGATTVLAVTGLGGTYGRCLADSGAEGQGRAGTESWDGAGLSSLFGSLAEELPGANVRAVDVDCFDDPVVLAGRIVAEAVVAGGPVAVGYRDDRRCTLVTGDPSAAIADDDQGVGWGPVRPVVAHEGSALVLIG